MRFVCGEVEQLPGDEFLRFVVGREENSSLQALHGDLAGSFMRWNLFACRKDQPDQFDIRSLHQGRRFCTSEGGSESQLNDLIGFSVMDRLMTFLLKELPVFGRPTKSAIASTKTIAS